MGILDLVRSRLVFADGGFGSLLIERGFPGGVPEERTPDFYARRPCPRLVDDAAAILDEILAETQAP